MDSCTTGPRYCQKCGKELEFGARICKECREVLPEKKSIFPQMFSKRPNLYKIIGTSLILITYIFGLWYPSSIIYLSSLFNPYFFFFPPYILMLLPYAICVFLVYVNIDYQSRGLIQICFGIFYISTIFTLEYRYFYYYSFQFILFNMPTFLAILCGVLTLKYNPIYSFFGFFSTLYLVSQVNVLLVALF